MMIGLKTNGTLGWLGIVRVGLVQTALGAIVVLTTSTLNRVMVVELGLLAALPGLLVGWHYAIQMLRPRWGYGADVTGRKTPWIIGGMGVLALGGALAAFATAITSLTLWGGILLSLLAFTLIGIGVGASGTALLTFLATTAPPERRAAAASIVWIMMIAGFVITAITVGNLLDPFSMSRLVAIATSVSGIAFAIAVIAMWGLERGSEALKSAQSAGPHAALTVATEAAATGRREPAGEKPPFKAVLAEVWREPATRRFTVFVFVSMLAYAMQDLILEPFAGVVFGLTPGESTKLAGVQHGGVLAGMIAVAVIGSLSGGSKVATLRLWTIGGCLASALALFGLVAAAFHAPDWPLETSVFVLGLANGAFAVAAIGSMMGLAAAGRSNREGTRMGMWGAAQAIAFGLGGFLGAVLVDVFKLGFETAPAAYACVFAIEAALFVAAAILAIRVGATSADADRVSGTLGGEVMADMRT